MSTEKQENFIFGRLDNEIKQTEKNKTKNKLTMWEMVIFVGALIIGVIIGNVIFNCFLKEYKLRNRLKYFSPIVKFKWYGKSISWQLRDKPINDYHLNKQYELLKQNKLL